jgi:hypothetical protein
LLLRAGVLHMQQELPSTVVFHQACCGATHHCRCQLPDTGPLSLSLSSAYVEKLCIAACSDATRASWLLLLSWHAGVLLQVACMGHVSSFTTTLVRGHRHTWATCTSLLQVGLLPATSTSHCEQRASERAS